MSRNQIFIVTNKNSEGEVYLATSGFRESIWRKTRSEATEFHSKTDAEKAAHTHGGKVRQDA